MSELNLTPDELLATTRSVRKRLDFSRPIEPEVIRECLELAVQAPTGSNSQGWQFVIVTDEAKRKALGDIYRKGYDVYRQLRANTQGQGSALPPKLEETYNRVRSSSDYLAEHMHEAPVLLVPLHSGPCGWQIKPGAGGLLGLDFTGSVELYAGRSRTRAGDHLDHHPSLP